MPETKRPLKVFLCHSHSDAAAVRALYLRLRREGVDTWLDKEKLLPGQDWELEIRKAVREADVVVVCLSKQFNQAGFRQKEVRLALDTAMEKPEGEIFIIPARLEECENLESLRKWHWVDLFDSTGYRRLMLAFKEKADRINATFELQEQYLAATPSDELFVKKIAATLGPRPIPWKIITGIIGIIFILFWIGSWAIPQVFSPTPTSETSVTPLLTGTIALSSTSIPITKTHVPNPISSATGTPYSIVFDDPHTDSSDYIDPIGVPMRLVLAGEFEMGSDDGESDEMPVHTVDLDAYHIDKYEVTNGLYRACVVAGECLPPQDEDEISIVRYYGKVEFDNHPVMYVNWDMARAYCVWRGARLPTEAEWEKAARGTDGRTFPWGEEIDPSFAHYDQSGNNPAPVGTYEKGRSIYSVYDMAGNAQEWVADWYSKNFYENSPVANPIGPVISQYRVLRGGTWYDDAVKVRASARSFSEPEEALLGFGFRCARSP
jgi:formylglycine-generating enzyme required for sulfatase activity